MKYNFCIFCEEPLEKESDVPVCKKKECVKAFVEIIGSFIQNVDELAEIDDTDGFIYNNHLIRYDHFDEDFDKAWEAQKK